MNEHWHLSNRIDPSEFLSHIFFFESVDLDKINLDLGILARNKQSSCVRAKIVSIEFERLCCGVSLLIEGLGSRGFAIYTHISLTILQVVVTIIYN